MTRQELDKRPTPVDLSAIRSRAGLADTGVHLAASLADVRPLCARVEALESGLRRMGEEALTLLDPTRRGSAAEGDGERAKELRNVFNRMVRLLEDAGDASLGGMHQSWRDEKNEVLAAAQRFMTLAEPG